MEWSLISECMENVMTEVDSLMEGELIKVIKCKYGIGLSLIRTNGSKVNERWALVQSEIVLSSLQKKIILELF